MQVIQWHFKLSAPERRALESLRRVGTNNLVGCLIPYIQCPQRFRAMLRELKSQANDSKAALENTIGFEASEAIMAL